jgi:hypothetical protein
MQKPELKEIAEYCGDTEQALLFFNYYESIGWKVGKNPMKNWKSAISGWMNRNKQKASKVDKALANRKTDVVNLLWKRMTEIYGHKWVSSYGTEPNKPWSEYINNTSDIKLKHGLNLILENGYDWPPSLPEFIKLCSSYKPQLKALPSLSRDEVKQLRNDTAELREQSYTKIREILNENN